MKTEQVNLRLEADLISALERAAAEECVDRGTLMRKLLLGALAQRRVDRALQQYQSGEISIGRAAEDAKLTHWEVLDLARQRGIAYQIDLEDIAERLELLDKPASDRVAESAAAYAVSGASRGGSRGRSKNARQGPSTSGGAATLPDRRPRPGGVLLVGLNPAPKSVAAGHYYQGRLGRRLWKRLVHVGLLTDAVPGAEDDAFAAAGHGLTDLVKRPTASERDLERAELQMGAQELREKVRAWQPGLVLFVFSRVAHLASGSAVSSGVGPLLEGVPTFLLSGPYAGRREVERVNAELRKMLSEIAGVPQAVLSQRVTKADLEAGIIRLPRIAKALLPREGSEDVPITLRGTPLTASHDPKRGSDRERSAVLRVGRGRLLRLVKPGEKLRVSKSPNGRLRLD